MKIGIFFGLSVGVLSLASLASAAPIGCVTPGPNPDNLVSCNQIATGAITPGAITPSAIFTYTVNESAVTIFNVSVLAGDIVLCDNPGVACDATHPLNWGDVLRFVSTGANSGSATLFSDSDEIGPVTPFDINLTTLTLQPLRLFMLEVGTEANNGIVYNNGDSIGTITSDSDTAVPEPSSLMLLGSALVAGLLVKRRL